MMEREAAQADNQQDGQGRAKRVSLLSLSIICALLAIFICAFNLGFASQAQSPTPQYAQAQTSADVLLIMSYDESDPNTPLARDGVLDVMGNAGVNVDVTYMNAYNVPAGSAQYNAWVSQVRNKLAQHGSYSVVICCDDEALTFVEQNHDSMFASTPVVFFGINDYGHALRAADASYATGMIEQSYVASIMEVTYNMNPQATSFTVIVDQTPAGVGNRAQFASAMEGYDDMGVRYINASQLTRSELASSVASADASTIVFLLDANTDRSGNVYTFDDSVAWVTSASSVPVYSATNEGVGSGIAGSAYLDPKQDGRQAASMAVDVLNGTSPAAIPLVVDGRLGYVFDGKVLSDYGVSSVGIPLGSTVVNRQIFSFNTLMVIAFPLLLLLVALFLFRKATRPQLATEAVGADEVPVAEAVAEEAPVAEELVAQAVAEAPVADAGAVAKRVKRQQLPQGRKPRAVKRHEHQRQLRKTHSVVAEDEMRGPSTPGASAPSAQDDEVASDVAVIPSEVSTAGDMTVIPSEAEGPQGEMRGPSTPALRASAQDDEGAPSAQDDEGAPSAQDDEDASVELAIQPADIRAMVGIEILDLGEIDDTYGAQTGAEVLRIIRKRLEGVENSCLLSSEDNRILLGFDTDIARGSQELELVEFLLRQLITIEENTITLNACIGVVNRQKNMDVEEMKSSVDFAITQANELGHRNIIVFYDANMRHAIQDRDKIAALLEKAIENEDFIVFYQPQIGLHSNEVVGYEALARLKNKAYPPSQFIPVAEVTGMIVDIDRIVTKRAVEQLAIWKRRNKRLRPISINFSSVHITRDDDYATYLLDLLETYDVSSEYIKIEVTETLFSDENQEKAEDLIKRMFDAGISIALDNFGVGYISFAEIMSIPASIIKIDKEYVDTFLIDGSNQNFEQLVRLAHGLGRKVVVVGVDKKWQIDVCRDLNCDVVQGYYFSKPLLPENAVQYKPRV